MSLNTEHRVDMLAVSLSTNGKLPNVGACMLHASIYRAERNKPWRTNALGIVSAVAVADKTRFTALPRRLNKHRFDMSGRLQGPKYQGLDGNWEPVWGDSMPFIGPRENTHSTAPAAPAVVTPRVKRVKGVKRVKMAKVVHTLKELIFDSTGIVMIRPGVFRRVAVEV